MLVLLKDGKRQEEEGKKGRLAVKSQEGLRDAAQGRHLVGVKKAWEVVAVLMSSTINGKIGCVNGQLQEISLRCS
jgi:hypothetical protein